MSNFKKNIVDFLERTVKIKQLKGEHRKARILEKSQSILLALDITDISQLENIEGIGPMTIRKCKEFVETGTTKEIEDYKVNPLFKFLNIHGVGIRKAEVLVKAGIKTIEQLRENQELLNDVQKKGLKYYEDINQRIPRDEIEVYQKVFTEVFDSVKNETSSYKIVGSFARETKDSGDIDLILTDEKDEILQTFIDTLIKKGIIVEILSRGGIKCLAIGKLEGKPARRIDFMYSPPKEYAFATLYFTGSRLFNTIMRKRALDLGYTMNEHGIYNIHHPANHQCYGVKTSKVDTYFPTEQSIFKFLKMEYREPKDRELNNGVNFNSVVKVKKNKTLKTRKSLKVLKNLHNFKQQGASILELLSEKEVAHMIKAADIHYYQHNKSLLSDEQYDILKSFALNKFPNNQTIENGHMNVVISKDKVELPYFMGSMEKIKPDTKALQKWLNTYEGPFVLSSKLDGISALYSTENGQKKLFTRGNGTKGLDISYLISHLQLPNIPNITIRGELLLTKSTFLDYAEDYKNVRNMIGGVMTTKKIEQDKWDDIDFVGYEVIKPTMKPSVQMRWLKENGVITVTNATVDTITNESLSKLLLELRENDPYNIDGIIVTDDDIYERTNRKCPKHAFAFKMVLSDQMMESQVVDVIWKPSKDGYIIPKIQIVPVDIGGTTITYASAHNAAFIAKNKIGIGSIVQMVRSGDVIPKIQKVIKHSEQPKMPDIPYVWNASHVDILLKDIQSNQIVQVKKIQAFMKTLDVPSFGEGNVKKVFAAEFNTIPKILSMKPEDFMTIPGFKEKLSNKIYNGIHEKLEKTTLADLMVATNIFGRGMGKSRAKAILRAHPDILVSNKSEEEKLAMVANIDGFALKTARAFVPNIPKFIEFIDKTNLHHKLIVEEVNQVDTNHLLFQKKIVMTGFRDKQLEKNLIEIGAELSNSVSKKTFVLLVDSLDSDSGKAAKAKKFGVTMMTPYAFQSKYLQ